jgi:competence protein ComEA
MFKKILAAMLALFAAAAFAAVDVNKATPAELDTIKGIGPATAAKIVEERKNGAFKDWQDMITRVKGVGDKNAAEFSTSGLTVNGAAFAGAPAKAMTPAAAPKKDEKAAATPAAPAPAAMPASATRATMKMPAESAAAASAPIDKKAAAKKDKEDKKAAKAAAADEAKKAKADKAAAAKAAKEGKPAAAASAAASAAKK